MSDRGVASDSQSFERLAGWSAILAGITGLGYAVAFLSGNGKLQGLFLLLAPLFSTLVLVALYRRLRDIDPGLALWALLIGIGGALGAVAHGGYNLAIEVNPAPGAPDAPFPVDPRGLFTFGLTGLALLSIAWLIRRSQLFPSWVAPAGAVLGVVLIVTYLGRLIVLDANSPYVRGPALVAGVLSPLFFLGLGWWLTRSNR